MTDPRGAKRSGSRRANQVWQRALQRRRTNFYGTLDADGMPIANDDAVGIEYACVQCGTLLGHFGMSTMPGAERTVFTHELPDGSKPEEAGRPEGKAKALLECDRCGRNKEISAAHMEQILNSIWEPNSRRVERRNV